MHFLFIGLGNVGSKTVRNALTTISTLQRDDALGVAIDTDEAIKGKDFQDIPNLKAIYLPSEDVTRALQKRSESPVLDSWLPKNFAYTETDHGAFGYRSMGRLAFILNLDPIVESIDFALSGLKSVQIFICATLGGGTSGILIELAYLLRSRLEKYGIKGTLHALLPFSKEAPESESIKANIYANLLELNHWMHKDTIYKFAIDLQEREKWRPSLEEEQAKKADASIEAILANLDLRLANNVNNVNPGLGKDKNEGEGTPGTKVTIDLKKDKSLDLSPREQPPVDSVILHTLERFDEEREIISLSNLLLRLYDWGFDNRKILDRLSSAIGGDIYLEDGTNSSFSDLHVHRVIYPMEQILDIAYSLAARTVIEELRVSLFDKNVSEDEVHGRGLAAEFIKSRQLKLERIDKKYKKRCHNMCDGKYDVATIIASAREELEKKPLYGQELREFVKKLDKRLHSIIEECQSDMKFFQELSLCTDDIVRNCSEGIDNSLATIVNAQHNGTAMIAFADEFIRLISFSLNAMHERLNNSSGESVRLESVKDQSIEKLAEFNPSFWTRLRNKVDFAPVDEAFKNLQEHYENTITSYVAREEINSMLSMLDQFKEVLRKMESLRTFLQDSSQKLNEINTNYLLYRIKNADESLLSTQESLDYITSNSVPKDVNKIIEEIHQHVSMKITDLVEKYSQEEWIELVKTVTASNNPILSDHVLQALFKKYPDGKRLEYIDNLNKKLHFHKDLGSFLWISFNIDLAGNFAEQLSNLPIEQKIEFIDVPEGECVDFVDIYDNFALANLDLEKYRQSYLGFLRRGGRFLHSRRDVRFKTLEHKSGKLRTGMLILLATAFQVGALGEREGQLTSRVWMDISTIRECFNTFEDPIDALFMEEDMSAELKKWRGEQLAKVGIEDWLKFLQADPDKVASLSSYLRAVKLDEYMNNLQQYMLHDLEVYWNRWKNDLNQQLSKDPQLDLETLSYVPAGFGNWLKRKWHEERLSLKK